MRIPTALFAFLLRGLFAVVIILLAAVLYALVVGYTGHVNTVNDLSFANVGSGSYGGTGHLDTFSIAVTPNVTTSNFILALTAAGTSLPGTSPDANTSYPCLKGVLFNPSHCKVPAGAAWYAVLVGSSDNIVDAFDASAGAWVTGGGTSCIGDYLLILVSGNPLVGSGDTLVAKGVGGIAIEGSVTL